MKIEHAAILYHDLEKAKRFFEDYFGAFAGKQYKNEKTGFSSYFLTFHDGCRLEIMNRPDAEESKEKNVFGFSHIAFSVIGEPRVTGDGYYESVITDTEGNTIEITV